MKTSRQPKQKVTRVQTNFKATVDKSGVHRFTKRTSQETNAVLETQKLPLLELCPERHLLPSAKIKLQLFPIDESTRMGLEKDGHCPYLELSLKVKKKIYSVVKHLNNKWGSSSVAEGKLMLFPFIKMGSLSNCIRWTSDDVNISAGDVYRAIGSPSVFRLRYGWFSTVTVDVCLDTGHVQKGCSFSKGNMDGKSEQIEVRVEDLNFRNVTEEKCTPAADKNSSILIDSMDKEEQTNNGLLQKSSIFYADGLTNISIGGLLSEASLLQKFNDEDPKGTGTNTAVRPTQHGHCTASRVQPKCPQEPSTSILDAEETCHAFLVNNISHSIKDVLAENAEAGGCFRDAGSKSFIEESDNQATVSRDHDGRAHKKVKPSPMCSRVYPDECSLGFRGIRWSDSLGPFDLGMPSSQKYGGGDAANISMSGFMR